MGKMPRWSLILTFCICIYESPLNILIYCSYLHCFVGNYSTGLVLVDAFQNPAASFMQVLSFVIYQLKVNFNSPPALSGLFSFVTLMHFKLFFNLSTKSFLPLSHKRPMGYCRHPDGWVGGVDTQVCERDNSRTCLRRILKPYHRWIC